MEIRRLQVEVGTSQCSMRAGVCVKLITIKLAGFPSPSEKMESGGCDG